MNDISSRADIDVLLRGFYASAFEDRLIGPYFTEIAGVDLEAHLPHIGDFWESALLRTGSYRRDALAPHQRLHRARPLSTEHFGRWLQLWRAAVDGLYEGPVAERAKAQGERVARVMPRRLDDGGATAPDDAGETFGIGFVPLAAVELRSRSAQGRSEPEQSEPGRSEPGQSEPARSEPGQSEQGRSEAGPPVI
ncbi:group III truncated hemoglobin [Streptomyces sp. NPDC021093]|uniref:group III truncated hemoglobin n=1 Tax=Streptomyces sp. NPDC021093 TaxID=3365112 RepID=UPI0037AB0832